MKKLLLVFTVLLPLFSCSDSAPDLSEYQGINYIESKPFDAGIETNWVRAAEATATYFDFDTVAPVTTGLPAGTTDYARLEVLNLMPNGGFEGGAAGWTNTDGSIGLASDGDSINPGNNSLEFTTSSRVYYNLDSLAGAADDTEYVIHFKFNTEATTVARFDYDDNSSSYLASPWTPATGGGYTSTDFPTSDGEDNIIEIETLADTQYFVIGRTGLSTQQTGHIDDLKIVRNDITLNIGTTAEYSEAGRPELYSGIYRFSIYVKKEDAADINPLTANRFPAETVTLYINGNPTAVDVSSVTDSEWVQISAEHFVQIYENDSINLAIVPYNATSPSLKTAGSILIAAPSLNYISD